MYDDGQCSGLKPAVAAVFCLLAAGCTTRPEQGDVWMSSEQANAVTQQMETRGMMPAAIDCRLDVPSTPPQYATRILWVPNTENVIWRWDVGDAEYMRQREASAALGNLTVVQRRTGADAYCAIWRS